MNINKKFYLLKQLLIDAFDRERQYEKSIFVRVRASQSTLSLSLSPITEAHKIQFRQSRLSCVACLFGVVFIRKYRRIDDIYRAGHAISTIKLRGPVARIYSLFFTLCVFHFFPPLQYEFFLFFYFLRIVHACDIIKIDGLLNTHIGQKLKNVYVAQRIHTSEFSRVQEWDIYDKITGWILNPLKRAFQFHPIFFLHVIKKRWIPGKSQY